MVTRISIPMNPNDDNKYISDKESFDSQEEMLLHMRDPRYQNEQGYREAVQKMIANSDAEALGLNPGALDYQGESNDELVNDWVRQAFGNPLYKTSAIYRQKVADMVAGSDYDHLIQGRINPRTGGCTRVTIMSADKDTGPDAPKPASTETK